MASHVSMPINMCGGKIKLHNSSEMCLNQANLKFCAQKVLENGRVAENACVKLRSMCNAQYIAGQLAYEAATKILALYSLVYIIFFIILKNTTYPAQPTNPVAQKKTDSRTETLTQNTNKPFLRKVSVLRKINLLESWLSKESFYVTSPIHNLQLYSKERVNTILYIAN